MKTNHPNEWIRIIQAGFPFVLFRLPGNEYIEAWAQNTPDLQRFQDFDELPASKGFVFAPFSVSDANPIFFLKPDFKSGRMTHLSDFFLEIFQEYDNNTGEFSRTESERELYLKNLRNLVRRLQSGEAEKVVISRTLSVNTVHNQHFVKVFEELCKTYPDAFVYLLRLANHEIWMGATPETLISCTGNHCTTMSLAGSGPLGSQKNWGSKEQEEQRIVTDYIEDKIRKHQIQNLRITEPYTKIAGQVEHLCSDFEFELCDRQYFASLVKQLHPTPAVCGIPLLQAKQLISRFETHEREYYTGFLGPVNYENQTALFVNLRCMKLLKNNTLLFVGGGITRDSVPEKEWDETELKSRTLLSVIEKFQNLAP